MKLKKYLLDHWFILLLFSFFFFLIFLFLLAFKVPLACMIAILLCFFLFFLISILLLFFRKKSFFDALLFSTSALDKSYLVLETIESPHFYEGELFCDCLYEINKSMNENVKIYEDATRDFKEYIEMWIHEVKVPLASLILILHNQKEADKRILTEIRKIDHFLEQVLYYVRQESPEKDYLIKKVSLEQIVHNVALHNKDDLLENHVEFITSDLSFFVYTDSKWLEFILNQVIRNAIKYRKESEDDFITIQAKSEGEQVILTIEDNGIGILSSDLPHVFEKTFTGYNGRIKTKSTGMGLFIAKKLCQRLGHEIKIDSEISKYTRITITFFNHSYYDVVQ